jgi:BirA family biotin operon repressor/biotin-[acetyl-CoA-carboxylase] ligase
MNTLFVGQQLIRLNSVDSTNNYALKMLRSGSVLEGTSIVCDFQTGGKGQRGNTWHSEEGMNLLFTVILHPVFLEAEEHFVLTKLSSLAIQKYLQDKILAPVRIKWPNDIFVNDSKIAGILIETVLKGNKIGSAVIGIGININQAIFPEVNKKVSSLKLETGQYQNLQFAFEEICRNIESNYLRIKANKNELDRVFERNLFGLNKWKNFVINGENTELMIKGVSKRGRLEAINRKNELFKFDFREIQFMP